MDHREPWCGVSGRSHVIHAAHQVSDTVTADRDPFSCQVLDHPPAATARIIQVERVDPGHDPQHGLTHRHRPVVERRSRYAQQSALPADAELRVVVIDQLAQFMGVRAAGIFC